MSRHLKRFWYVEITNEEALTADGEIPDTFKKSGLRVVKAVPNTQYTVLSCVCELHCHIYFNRKKRMRELCKLSNSLIKQRNDRLTLHACYYLRRNLAVQFTLPANGVVSAHFSTDKRHLLFPCRAIFDHPEKARSLLERLSRF